MSTSKDRCTFDASTAMAGGTTTASTSTRTTTSASPAAAPALSKAALYVSLAAYNNQARVDPVEFMRNQASTPKSIHEGSLVDFWQKVSERYHRSSYSISKNTAGRPLSTQEISDKLKQRALTLVGGGFNTQLGGSKAAKSSSSRGYRQNRRRKRKRQDRKTVLPCPREVVEQQTQFLTDLNGMWNEYARSLLLGGDNNDATSTQIDNDDLFSNNTATAASIVTKRIVSRTRNPTAFEWIGAKVRVEACHQHPTWVGREGILVGETKRTWRIIQIIGAGRSSANPRTTAENKKEPPYKKHKKETIIDDDDDDDIIKTLVLPKPKSSLQVILPLDCFQTPENNKDDNNNNNKSISHTKRQLCILLKDTKKDKKNK